VEPQTETVWRQANKYDVPRMCFVNKMDRVGADFYRCVEMIKDRLDCTTAVVQLPIGAESDFLGVVDLVIMKALVWEDGMGEDYEERDIPADMVDQAEEARQELIDVLSNVDDVILEKYLGDEEITVEDLKRALRSGTLSVSIVPILCGTAFKNKGVQPMLDAVVDFLPSPLDLPPTVGTKPNKDEEITREVSDDAPFSALAFKIMTDPYVGKLTYLRVYSGTLEKGGTVSNTTKGKKERIGRLLQMHANSREDLDVVRTGDICAGVGLKQTTTGDTLADPDNPIPLEPLTVDEPSLSMTIGINTSPIAGQEGKLLTARMVKDRLDKELIGNVSIRVLNTERPDTWEVQGRGELQLAVLIETMRREGFELTVGKPRVVTKEIDGKVHEPFERATIDIPEEFVGNVTSLLSQRKGSMLDMVNHGTGWVRLEWRIPSRGLVGVRTEFMTETRGTGILNHVFDGYSPWVGEIRHRQKGVLVADRRGVTTTYTLIELEARGVLFVDAGVDVYEGMIIGENSRQDEMNVNPTKEKKLTNMRASGSDNTERMTPPTVLSLEQALEFIADDEAVEITPKSIRLRKVVLDQSARARLIKSQKPAK